MKKLMLTGVFLIIAGTSYAEPPGGFIGRPTPPTIEERIAHLTEVLSLSDEQVDAVAEVLYSIDEERQAITYQLENLRQSEQQELEALLTDEQIELLSSSRPQRGRAQNNI